MTTKFRPQVEVLEDRQLLSNTSMEAVASLFPRHPGATHLDMNFEGRSSNNPLFTTDQTPYVTNNTDRDIQDILFRTAERFAPFDVEVARRIGHNSIDKTNGASTIFIGPDVTNYPQGTTPYGNTDSPSGSTGPNTDTYDYAYVMPPTNINTWSTEKIAATAAHEAGHTFGLVHVRTIGADPDPLVKGPDNLPDIMRYDGFKARFVDQSLSITNFNNNPDDNIPTLQGDFDEFDSDTITQQNSFQYLRSVLGDRAADDFASVAHPGFVDSIFVDAGVGTLPMPTPRGFDMGGFRSIAVAGKIDRRGDYDVFNVTPTSSDPLTISVTRIVKDGLDPIVLVYHTTTNSFDTLVSYNDDKASGNLNSKTIVFSPVVGDTYRVVVGAHNNTSTGRYSVSAQSGWAGISAPTISINNLTISKSTAGENPNLHFTVTLSHPWNEPIKVDYKPLAKLQGVVLKSGTITFQPGDLQKSIAVNYATQPPGKGTRHFSIQLSSKAKATFSKTVGVGTIIDDTLDETLPNKFKTLHQGLLDALFARLAN